MSQSAQSAREEWRTHAPLAMAATAGVSLAALSQSTVGVMMAPLEEAFGWSRVTIASGTSLASFTTLLLATAIGLAIDRIGPRRIAIVATMLICAALALLAGIANSRWQWWGLWLLIGIGSAAMPTVWLKPVTAAFTTGRGLAVAVVLSGSGLSTFLVPVIANQLIEQGGWRMGYLGLGLIWAAVCLPLVLLYFHAPGSQRPPAGLQPAGDAPLPAGYTAREGFASANFHKLLLAAFLSTLGGVALVLNMVPVLTAGGITRASAAAIAGLVGIATIIGRITGGWLMDRMSARIIAAGSTLGAALLPALLLALPGSAAAAALGVAVYGLAGGAKIGAIAYLASRHLGNRAFGTLYGTISAGLGLAVTVAPLAANLVYDRTRSYDLVLWAALPVLLIAALIYLSLGRYPDFAARPAPPA